MSAQLSHRIAARRGVGRTIVTRDNAGAPVLDLELDLTRADATALEGQRVATLARISAPQAGDDLGALASRGQAVATAITAHNAAVAQADSARAALGAAGSPVGRVAHVSEAGAGQGGGDADAPAKAERLSPGLAFARHADIRAYAAANARGTSAHVEVPSLTRATFGTDGYPSVPTRVPGIQTPTRDTPLTILDLVDRQSTSTNHIEWVQETAVPGGAAEVAEGGQKPESTWGVELKSEALATIAHYINITRQAVADESQLQGYIEGRLTYGLMKRLNAQVLTGNGTSPNLRGILNTTGIGVYVSAAGEDKLIAIRKARTVAELSEYAPDAVAIHPSDWEDVELSVDDEGRFRAVVSVADGVTPRVWGLTVVVTTNVTVGTSLLGAFREGATLWERSGVDIYITDSHASNFTTNILTMLAELRAGLSVWRPKAFVKITFTPAAG